MLCPSTNYCQHIENLISMNIDDLLSYITNLPNNLASKEEQILYAATIEYLCNNKGISKPNWLNDEKLTSPTPLFACDTQNKEFQQFLIETTPKEFASRNIFYGNDLLRRI